MKLVVVESPTKAKTLSRFLGEEFQVVSSMGHVRDLPKSELGVDVERNFEPKYLIAKGKEKIVQELKKAAKEADLLFLATDPDREGEAIAWHVSQVLADRGSTRNKTREDAEISVDQRKHPRESALPVKRVVFHEITKEAIKEAFEHPRDLNLKLVDSQQARRILDRLVGYKLSPLLWKKVRYGLSAGRVQSVAVRLVVEREREREAFKPEEYWVVEAELQSKQQNFKAKLDSISGKGISVSEKIDLFDGVYTVTSTSIGDEERAQGLVSKMRVSKFVVAEVESHDQRRSPYPPFTTSTLQQAAVNVLGFSAKRTMRAAQNLYEAGLITYHRTDSVTLAERALREIRELIGSSYGSTYLPETANRYKTKVRLAQEAHEAIRPTRAEVTSDKLPVTSEDEKKLYELIWRQTVACQMADAVLALTRVGIEADGLGFRTNGSQIKFDGFLKVFGRSQEVILPPLEVGDELTLVSLNPTQGFTSLPPRYTEASLIKSLEEKGIGRPSTYAPIISTIQDRDYVSREGKQLRPEDVGIVVNDLLVAYFPNVVDLSFTAKMEEELDEVAGGKREWVPVVREFYEPFAEDLEKAQLNIERSSITTLEETEEKCPECGKPLVIKLGRYGRFYSCSGFPKCKFAKPFIEKIGMKCPGCGEATPATPELAQSSDPPASSREASRAGGGRGEVIVKRTRRGKIFYGCSRYPECQWASWTDPRKAPSEEQ